MRRIILISILIAIFISSCSGPLKQSLYNIGERPVSREKIYDNSFEKTWMACEGVLQESKVTINAIDKASGLLTYTLIPLDFEKISGGVLVPDNRTTRKETTLHVNILLTSVNDRRTKVRIHSLFRTPYSDQLFSTGLVEDELFKKIELKLKDTDRGTL